MSTLVDFVPSTIAAPSFQPTLNGTQYNATILYNQFERDYYLQLSDLSGNLIVFRSLTSSGPVLQATLSWASNVAMAACTTNHNVPIATLANVLVSQTGTAYDGSWQALAVSPTTFTYALTTNPQQPAPLQCNLEFPLNLVQGYLSNCYLFYYDATEQFEYSG